MRDEALQEARGSAWNQRHYQSTDRKRFNVKKANKPAQNAINTLASLPETSVADNMVSLQVSAHQ